MLQRDDGETELVLGNKQLLGIFFVVAALLGVAFTGGYMLGRGPAKKAAPAETATTSPSAAANAAETARGGQPGETHSIPPADEMGVSPASSEPEDAGASAGRPARDTEEPLGSRKHRETAKTQPRTDVPVETSKPAKAEGFSPESGQQFLQVTAVAHEHANAVAEALRKKGFHAHAVPKPGDPNLYRVIVGPIHDPGELASTRDSLRKTGFSNVIVQHYQ